MKRKIVSAIFDKETGISTVTIETDLGLFTGVSKLHEEDKVMTSKYAGCEYAEMKAYVKCMKAITKNLKLQRKTLSIFNGDLTNMKGYNPNSLESRKLRKRIYMLDTEIKDWEDRINSLQKKMRQKMEQRCSIVHKIINKGEQT